jgi:hypothetical protein
VADDPDPVVRAGAAGRLLSCDGPAHLGGWSMDFGGPHAGAADPSAALEAFLRLELFGLPATGYRPAASDGGRQLFVYAVDDEPKVTVIVADAAVVDGELPAPDGWAPTSTITSFPGPERCDWQSVTFMHLDGRQYLRDPEHRLTRDCPALRR